jgi:diketogulonate reductase-like aldo/keto reductase
MERCVQLGLTKSIGISNFNMKQVKDILGIATIIPVVNQVMSHLRMNINKLSKTHIIITISNKLKRFY